MIQELPNVQAKLQKGKGTRGQIVTIFWIMEKARDSQKNVYFCFIDYAKAFDCVGQNKPLWLSRLVKLWRNLKERRITDHLTYLLRNLYVVRNQQNNWTGSKWGKEYYKAVYCHHAYLTYMQSTSWKCWAGWITSWNQDCWNNFRYAEVHMFLL